jgi:hypothetical protein
MELVRLYPDEVGFEVWTGSRRVGRVGRDKIALLASGTSAASVAALAPFTADLGDSTPIGTYAMYLTFHIKTVN